MQQVQVNKWGRFGLTVVAALLVSLSAYPWTDLVDKKTAAVIGLAILGLKGLIDAIAPSAGVPTAPTGSSTSIITHTAVS
jgi:hypothetical protein